MQDPAELDVIHHFWKGHTSQFVSIQSDVVVASSVVYRVRVLWEILFWFMNRTSDFNKHEFICETSAGKKWYFLWLELCLSWWVVFLDVVYIWWLWLIRNVLIYIDGIIMNCQQTSDYCFVTCSNVVIMSWAWWWLAWDVGIFPVPICFNSRRATILSLLLCQLPLFILFVKLCDTLQHAQNVLHLLLCKAGFESH